MPKFFNATAPLPVEETRIEIQRSRLDILKRALILIEKEEYFSPQFEAVYSLKDMRPCLIKEARLFSFMGAIFKGAGRERHEWIPWAFTMQEIYYYELLSYRMSHLSSVDMLENLILIEEVIHESHQIVTS